MLAQPCLLRTDSGAGYADFDSWAMKFVWGYLFCIETSLRNFIEAELSLRTYAFSHTFSKTYNSCNDMNISEIRILHTSPHL